MKSIILFSFCVFVFTSIVHSQPTLTWAKTMGGPQIDQGSSVAIDASGNVYSTGYFIDSADFDPSPDPADTFFLRTDAPNRAIFISKLDAYPNPIVNNKINLQFINQPKGTYIIRLINQLGQIILTKQVTYIEGSSTEAIELNSTIQKGHYTLEVTAPDKSRRSLKIVY